jgi:pyrroloquinoline quinone (PQQ) biosynthesis protein C
MPTLLTQPSLGIDVGDARERLVAHRLYPLVNSPARLRRFMEHHVFAVWDFQCLLKALQQKFTCTSAPWLPTPDREARRLVNEIVLDEESDELPEGGYASHFELYVESMEAAGADTRPIAALLEALAAGAAVPDALAAARVPHPAARFVKTTFEVIDSGSTPAIAAAFTFGREDVIPDMFRHIVASLAEQDPASWGRFRYYLERHIAHDDAKHAPICRRIVASLCGDDPAAWAEASRTARKCLEARIALWDAIADVIV